MPIRKLISPDNSPEKEALYFVWDKPKSGGNERARTVRVFYSPTYETLSPTKAGRRFLSVDQNGQRDRNNDCLSLAGLVSVWDRTSTTLRGPEARHLWDSLVNLGWRTPTIEDYKHGHQ